MKVLVPRHRRPARPACSPSGCSSAGTTSSASIAARGATRPPASRCTRSTSASAPPRTCSARRRPDAVIHMATVTHLVVQQRGALPHQPRRHARGLRALPAPTASKHVVFVGRHTYYGAAPDSPLYHTEDEPPMAARARSPSSPTSSPPISTPPPRSGALPSSPRPCCASVYTLGPTGHGHARDVPARPRVPTVLGFDPLFQFMHEQDVVSAHRARARRSACAASSTSPARSRCRSRC